MLQNLTLVHLFPEGEVSQDADTDIAIFDHVMKVGISKNKLCMYLYLVQLLGLKMIAP